MIFSIGESQRLQTYEWIKIDGKKYELKDVYECLRDIERTGKAFWTHYEFAESLLKYKIVLKVSSKDLDLAWFEKGPKFDAFMKTFDNARLDEEAVEML